MKLSYFLCIILLPAFFAACGDSGIEMQTHSVSGKINFCDEPYEGGIVTLFSERFGKIVCRSDENGIYTFNSIWDGDYTVSFYSDTVEFYPPELNVSVNGSDVAADSVLVVKSWKKSWGSTLDERIDSVIQTSDYGFLAGGEEGTSKLTAVLLKYDRNGDLEWKYSYTGSNTSASFFGVAENSGGYIAAGNSYSTGDTKDAICFYFDKSTSIEGTTATPLWTYSGSELYFDAACSVALDLSGTGDFFLGGAEGKESGSQYDFYLRSFNSLGQVGAERRITAESGSVNSITAIAQSGDVCYFLGSSDSNTQATTVLFETDRTLLGEVTSSIYEHSEIFARGVAMALSGSGKYLYVVLAMKDAAGSAEYGRICRVNVDTREWEDSVDLGKRYLFTSITTCTDGGVVVGGSKAGDGDGDGVSTALIAKFDGNLRLQYSREFAGACVGQDEICSVKQTHDGGYVVGGRISDKENYGHEYLLLKLNRDGERYGQ